MNNIQTRLVCFRETLRQKQERTMQPIILFCLDFFVLKFLLQGNGKTMESLKFCNFVLKEPRSHMLAELSGREGRI